MSLTLCTVYLSILPCIIYTVSLHITHHTAGKFLQTEIFTNFAPNFFGQPKLPRGNLEQRSGCPVDSLKNSLKFSPVDSFSDYPHHNQNGGENVARVVWEQDYTQELWLSISCNGKFHCNIPYTLYFSWGVYFVDFGFQRFSCFYIRRQLCFSNAQHKSDLNFCWCKLSLIASNPQIPHIYSIRSICSFTECMYMVVCVCVYMCLCVCVCVCVCVFVCV